MNYGGITTAADGSWYVRGLPARTDYKVCFGATGATGGSSDATGYDGQCWQNKTALGTPTPVAVTSGAIKSGIDAALNGGGTISGTVTDAGGPHHGLANVSVRVSSPSTGAVAYATTAADGSYTAPALGAGTDYQVCFIAWGATGGSLDATGYVDQCWQNQPSLGTPTQVVVTPGAATGGINAVLVGGGAISGTVTDAGGAHHGLANVSVYVFSATADGGWAITDTEGNYTVTRLAAGTDYRVQFFAWGATGGSSDALGYLNLSPTDTSTSVTVTLGATRTGINTALVGARVP